MKKTQDNDDYWFDVDVGPYHGVGTASAAERCPDNFVFELISQVPCTSFFGVPS